MRARLSRDDFGDWRAEALPVPPGEPIGNFVCTPSVGQSVGQWTFRLNLENETTRTQVVTLMERGIQLRVNDVSGSKERQIGFTDVTAPIRCDRSDLMYVQVRGGDLRVSVNQFVEEDAQRLRQMCEAVAETHAKWTP